MSKEHQPVKITESQEGPKNLRELIQGLHELFAPETVNADRVKRWLELFPVNLKEMEPYSIYDPHRYTRNLVDAGNGRFNLILMGWGEGQSTGIHDHSGSHCFMKIIDGEVIENLFDWPDENKNEQMLKSRKTTVFRSGQVAYINDSLGLHRIGNSSDVNKASSLHVYVPAYDMCHRFDDRTGQKIAINLVFHSKYGERYGNINVNMDM